MCRQCVFTNHAAQKRERETQLQEIVAEQHRNDLRTQEVKRNKRQHERFVKHQKKKEQQPDQEQEQQPDQEQEQRQQQTSHT